MVNKKAWIRIVEASIAVLIIVAVIITVSQTRKQSAESDLTEIITPILDEIAKNTTFREAIITDDDILNNAENMILAFLNQKIQNPVIGYALRICAYSKPCGLEKYPPDARGSIYAGERIISSTLATQGSGPRKIEIFMWIKQ